MLKIKDNVDLKELEKFGFKVDRYNLWYEYHAKNNFKDSIVIKVENKKIGYGKSYDTLFDLIQAGLVEKMEDK